jgi:hypothetical protein
MVGLVCTVGQLVAVTTRRLGSNAPLRAPFVVAEPDPRKAEALVSKVLTPGVTVKAICPLAPNDIEAYGLKPGEFTKPWWAI